MAAAGRGAQVVLDGDAQAAARGGKGDSQWANWEVKRALELAGLVADGSTPNGTTVTGAAPHDGAAGPAGPTGPQGATGATGADGKPGADGKAGTTGATGPQGPAGGVGLTGATGDKGAAGAAGAAGTQGLQGAAGTAGSAGAVGATGATGPQGLTGNAGAAGAQGIQGVAGPTGPTGLTGNSGAAGATGAQGTQGIQGTAGTAGTAGTQGIQGVAGPSTMPGFDTNYVFNAPVTGFNLTISATTTILDPAGTLAAGTLTFPAAPVDGQILRVNSSRIITALTLAGNGKTLKTTLTTIAAGGFFEFMYRATNATWYRTG